MAKGPGRVCDEMTSINTFCTSPRNTSEGRDAEEMCSGRNGACKVGFMLPKHINTCVSRAQAGLSGDMERTKL